MSGLLTGFLRGFRDVILLALCLCGLILLLGAVGGH
jgi:hypothetical protein